MDFTHHVNSDICFGHSPKHCSMPSTHLFLSLSYWDKNSEIKLVCRKTLRHWMKLRESAGFSDDPVWTHHFQ